MKRVLWMMSALGLTVAHSSAAQSNTQDVAVRYVTVSPNSADTSDIDGAINRLIALGSSSRIYSSNAPVATTDNDAAKLSVNHQTAAQTTSNQSAVLAAKTAAKAAHGSSIGRCALYVRKALQSAGYKFTPQPSAYQYAHGTLEGAGFTKISNDNYVPQAGDVAVFNRTSRNPHGHIQIYDGNQWVSDFRQNKFSPYRQHNGYTVWRDTRGIDASANTGTMLALNEQ